MTPDELHDRLSTLADPACKAFGDSLQPGVTDRLGVRMPLVRRVARDVMRTEDVRAFLNAMLAAGGFASQEALMVCVIVAGGAKALELLGGGTSRALVLAASGDYYLSMSLAWCLSMLATADLEAVCSRIESWRAEGRLDDATLRRTVRKIRESLQFTKETKAAVSARFAAR